MLDALSSSSLKGALDALAERATKAASSTTDAAASDREFAASLARFFSVDKSGAASSSNESANGSNTGSSADPSAGTDVTSTLQLYRSLSAAAGATAEMSTPESQPLVGVARLNNTTSTTATSGAASEATVEAPFSTFEEFKTWEDGLGCNLAEGYETPDYIHAMGLSYGGGDDEAFRRYVFFKNNPGCAVDFERIHNGQLSQYPTDGSTLRDNGHAAYRLASYDTGTGNLVDLDGKQYNPVTGTLQA